MFFIASDVMIFKGLLFIVAIVSLSLATADNCTPVETELEKFHTHVLTRHVRAVVFPKNARLSVSPGFDKAISGGRPKGLTFTFGVDVSYPLPDSIESWSPKLEQPKTTPPAQTLNLTVTTPTTINIPVHEYQQKQVPYYGDHYVSYNFPFHKTIWDRKYSSKPTFYAHKKYKANYYGKLLNTPGMTTGYFPNYRVTNNFDYNLQKKLNKVKEMPYGYHDRARRQLLEQFNVMGELFNFDIKNCIQRAICELNSRLHPYGESVIEDIVRIILIPLNSAGEYEAGNYKNMNCKQHFKLSCPYSIFDILYKN